MRGIICMVVRMVGPGQTRPCCLPPNHSGEHVFIFRGEKVNEKGEPANRDALLAAVATG